MSALAPIRVLVIDDSALSRQTITRILESSPLVEVAGVARNGEDALRKVIELAPDCVTLDLEMPRMDGFAFLRLVMRQRPTPVIVISGHSGREDVFKALELGAVDFVAKPTLRVDSELSTIEQELIRKVHAVRHLRIEKVQHRMSAPPSSLRRARVAREPLHRVVAIGSSTGGPGALMQIFGSFAEAPPFAFVVAQHMPVGFTRSFAERVDRLTSLRAVEAQGGEEPRRGTVLIAPGGGHLEFDSRRGRVVTRVVSRKPGDRYAPSIDRLFESAAKHFGSALLAIVLTGMGDDGRRGVASVSEYGGSVVAESADTAVIFGMPQQAIRTGAVDAVLPLPEIASAIWMGVGSADLQHASEGIGDE